MAKFKLPATDFNYAEGIKSGTINGGTVLLDHIATALRWHGHDAHLVPLTEMISPKDTDYVFIQSEWWGMPNIQQFILDGGKVICLLGHFIKHVYPDPNLFRHQAYLIVTAWSGECTEGFNAKFWPHAYSDLTDSGATERSGEIVWSGNRYQLRKEDWWEGLENITPIRGTLPKDLFPIYRGASVCPNLHGDFQKNIVSHEPSRIADKPGTMINERFWSILGCGGVMVTDYTPQMEMFFKNDDLIIGVNKDDWQNKIRYFAEHKNEGLAILDNAREFVRKNHTYKERVRELLTWLNETKQ